MFTSIISLLDEYYRAADRANTPGFNRNLAGEFKARLEQLQWILARIRETESVATGITGRYLNAFHAHIQRTKDAGLDLETTPLASDVSMSKEEFQRHSSALMEIEVLRDAFYFLAFRAQQIANSGAKPMPGVRFDARGVRNVRNLLIEHPERADPQVLMMSSAWGGKTGPVVKALREGGQEDAFVDRGLYVNAAEYRDKVERALRRAIVRVRLLP